MKQAEGEPRVEVEQEAREALPQAPPRSVTGMLMAQRSNPLDPERRIHPTAPGASPDRLTRSYPNPAVRPMTVVPQGERTLGVFSRRMGRDGGIHGRDAVWPRKRPEVKY